MASCFVACHHHPEMQAAALEQESAPAKIAGRWQMTMDSPHGTVKGSFEVKQDGSKTTAKFEAEMFGTLAGTGTVEGNKVSFSLAVPNGPQSFGFSGTVDGSKMSGQTEMGGAWSASREWADRNRPAGKLPRSAEAIQAGSWDGDRFPRALARTGDQG